MWLNLLTILRSFECGQVFLLYDRYVEHRQKVVLSTAVKSNAIVSSLFPENVRDRLMDEAIRPQTDGYDKRSSDMFRVQGDTSAYLKTSKPIADFFPSVTCIFAE